MPRGRYVIPFSELRMTDIGSVGGKNASLGEMLSQLSEVGIRVPDGFATTADAFREFLGSAGLVEKINALESGIASLSDAQLQAKTPAFRQRIGNGESIDDLLPEAFAVCREA